MMREVKANNRLCKNKLFEAEEYSLLSKILVDTEYPLEEYKRAWENVLFIPRYFGWLCNKRGI